MLSSLEIAVLVDADAMAMQNIDHAERVLSLVNCLPAEDHGTDFSRVRPWCLDNCSALYRQTIILSQLMEPSLLGLFHRHCRNHAGKLRIRAVAEHGTASTLDVPVKQLFQRLNCESLATSDDTRLAYFVKVVLPKLENGNQDQTILFMQSYYDFVKVRNLMVERNIPFVAVHEYSRTSEVSRSRSRFFRKQKPILLYSGRAHFFFRYALRGAQHVVFYSLPDHDHFYSEIVGFLGEATLNGDTTTATALFTRYDQLALERIVGSASATCMLQASKEAFVLF